MGGYHLKKHTECNILIAYLHLHIAEFKILVFEFTLFLLLKVVVFTFLIHFALFNFCVKHTILIFKTLH